MSPCSTRSSSVVHSFDSGKLPRRTTQRSVASITQMFSCCAKTAKYSPAAARTGKAIGSMTQK